jgi:hypothetical protein
VQRRWSTVNQDLTRFPGPERLDLTSTPNGQLLHVRVDRAEP